MLAVSLCKRLGEEEEAERKENSRNRVGELKVKGMGEREK